MRVVTINSEFRFPHLVYIHSRSQTPLKEGEVSGIPPSSHKFFQVFTLLLLRGNACVTCDDNTVNIQ